MRSLVLDRSYLQSRSVDAIHLLCNHYRVIMTESLFFEILTAAGNRMSSLFAKFPQRDNPVVIVGHVGQLMRHEVKHGEPASPAEKLVLVERFCFSPRLASGQFTLTLEHRAGIEEWEQDLEQFQKGFLDRYSLVHQWFPGLASYKPGQDPQSILAAQQQVASDGILVATVYERIKPRGFPETVNVGPAWAVFRWVQVQLLYALEYLRRYRPGRPEQAGKRVANDVIDSKYLLTALLADALATGDDQIASFYSLLKPHGELLR